MKKILYVIPSLGAGGAEKAAVLIANELIRSYGYHVTFFLASDDLYYRELLDPSANVVNNDLFDRKSRLRRIWSSNIVYGRSLYNYLKTHEFDIVISGYEFNGELPVIETAVIDSMMRRKRKIQYVSVLQNALDPGGSTGGRRSGLVRSFVSCFRKRVFETIIAVSHSIKEELPRSVRGKVSIIGNPIDRALILDRSAKQPPSVPEADVAKPYFINIARIAHQKNQLSLVKAFDLIRHDTDWNLLLVGHVTDREYDRSIRDYVREHQLTKRIFLAGTVENPYVLLRNAGAFVFSSRYEGTPLAILEAMALKKIVISTRFHGCQGLLTDANSLLVDVDDPAQLAQAMKNVAAGSVEGERMTETAFRALDAFDVGTVARRYHECFNDSGTSA